MSRYIDAEWLKAEFPHNEDWNYPVNTNSYVVEMIDEAPSIDIVMCPNCRKCKEQGGHANCNGYLYCTRQKTLVDEDCFCSWGERREP